MYKFLYDNFKHWFRGGRLYFYSDPHFNSPEMIYLRSNYITDLDQVKRINKKIGKNDTIVFLGDIGDESFIKKIRGYKILIKGNHDRGNINYVNLFNEIYEGPIFISDKILLSHEPISIPFGINIHGHDHGDRIWLAKCPSRINWQSAICSTLEAVWLYNGAILR